MSAPPRDRDDLDTLIGTILDELDFNTLPDATPQVWRRAIGDRLRRRLAEHGVMFEMTTWVERQAELPTRPYYTQLVARTFGEP